ncbi:HPr family phosphocarrier protein [Brevibacillus sp. SYSU BS000544]|uniref:HPr family phosphocarrier protein n=1 Tax=Brevibacillus sp. SYSU BS000544 TaxID=3416443 RepID=UPI003CE4FDCF
MIRFTVKVTTSGGLHARPASVLVNQINKYTSSVTIRKNGKEANGRSLLSVMALGAKTGDEVEFEVSGEDEEEVAVTIQGLFQKNS